MAVGIACPGNQAIPVAALHKLVVSDSVRLVERPHQSIVGLAHDVLPHRVEAMVQVVDLIAFFVRAVLQHFTEEFLVKRIREG